MSNLSAKAKPSDEPPRMSIFFFMDGFIRYLIGLSMGHSLFGLIF